MPALKREDLKWKACEYCGNTFPDTRSNRRFDKASCRWNSRRVRKRHGAIAHRGGKCETCEREFNPEWDRSFFVLQDGTVICGDCLSRRSRERFYKGREEASKHKRGHPRL
jgi:hypothetical protein